MPLHNFRCSECGAVFEAFHPLTEMKDREQCPKCHGLADKTFEGFCRNSGGGIRVFKPFWHEHVGLEPVYIESKGQLHDLCQREGLYCKGIENSFNRRF